jgi:hypothetical protein
MDRLVYLLPVLGCAAMMAVMVWTMRPGHGRSGAQASSPDPQTAEEIAQLRTEIAVLRDRQGLPAGDDIPPR